MDIIKQLTDLIGSKMVDGNYEEHLVIEVLVTSRGVEFLCDNGIRYYRVDNQWLTHDEIMKDLPLKLDDGCCLRCQVSIFSETIDNERCKDNVKMNRYKITTEIASELTIEQVEDLLTGFIDSEIGFVIKGSGEVINEPKFETRHNNKCPKVTDKLRPRCMYLDYLNGDICTSFNGCISK